MGKEGALPKCVLTFWAALGGVGPSAMQGLDLETSEGAEPTFPSKPFLFSLCEQVFGGPVLARGERTWRVEPDIAGPFLPSLFRLRQVGGGPIIPRACILQFGPFGASFSKLFALLRGVVTS